MKNFLRIIGITALAAVFVFSMAACGDDDDTGGGAGDKTPLASHYDFDNLEQSEGNGIVAVEITRKSNASPGTISNILYDDDDALPTTAGTYAVTFDVAAATGWKAATGLSAGNLVVTPGFGEGPEYSRLYAEWYDTQANATSGTSGKLFEFTQEGKLKIASSDTEYYYKAEDNVITVLIDGEKEALSYSFAQSTGVAARGVPALVLAEESSGSAPTLSAVIGTRYKAIPDLVSNGDFTSRASDWPNLPLQFDIDSWGGVDFKWETDTGNGNIGGAAIGWADWTNGPPYGWSVGQTITDLTAGYYTFSVRAVIKERPDKIGSYVLNVYDSDGITVLKSIDVSASLRAIATATSISYFRAYWYDLTDILVTGDKVTVEVKADNIQDVVGIKALSFMKY